MSLVDLDELSPGEILVQCVLEYRDKGISLSYLDYDCIDLWLKEAQGDVDLILVILSEVLPKHFSDRNKKSSGSLKAIHSRIVKRIQNARCLL